jgi:glycerol-3-phosphate dehydrogenase (NAD(P)+)
MLNMKNPGDQQPIAILGAGSWGTALALYLARQGQSVRLWNQNKARIITMQAERANNHYLPGHVFPSSLQLTDDLQTAIADQCDILIAVPSAGFRHLLQALKPIIAPAARVVWVTKGLDAETGELLHAVAETILGKHCYAMLSGPSFASEVAAGLPTAVVIASNDAEFSNDLLIRFISPLLRVYLSADLKGVEAGGAVKNIIAIATGIADGMRLGANARSALITRGLAEITRIGIALGGQYETFTGLAGVGDLVLTCTDDQSRNRRFGLALGGGKSVAEAEQIIGQVIEGKTNAQIVAALAKKLNVEMPITETVHAVLQSRITINEAMQHLLARAPKQE